MDASLLKEREAFKKRAKAIPVVEKKPSSTAKGSGEASVQQKHKKKKKSAYSRPKPVKLQTGNYIFMQKLNMVHNSYIIVLIGSKTFLFSCIVYQFHFSFTC